MPWSHFLLLTDLRGKHLPKSHESCLWAGLLLLIPLVGQSDFKAYLSSCQGSATSWGRTIQTFMENNQWPYFSHMGVGTAHLSSERLEVIKECGTQRACISTDKTWLQKGFCALQAKTWLLSHTTPKPHCTHMEERSHFFWRTLRLSVEILRKLHLHKVTLCPIYLL